MSLFGYRKAKMTTKNGKYVNFMLEEFLGVWKFIIEAYEEIMAI
jgi:hypothetical protein